MRLADSIHLHSASRQCHRLPYEIRVRFVATVPVLRWLDTKLLPGPGRNPTSLVARTTSLATRFPRSARTNATSRPYLTCGQTAVDPSQPNFDIDPVLSYMRT